MSKKEITIAEACKLTGKSTDTIGIWIKKNPNGSRKTEKGRRLIEASKLAEDYPFLSPQQVEEEERRNKLKDTTSAYLERLEEENKALRKQLEELREDNRKLAERYHEATQGFTEALNRTQTLVENQQKLTLAQSPKLLKKHFWSRSKE